MEKKPSDIHTKKEHKLTRRRIMKMLTASGVAPAAASRITVDDVKAADSDQIPISLDVDGEYKENVPADWYDQVKHAEKVRDKIANNHGHRKSILAIGVRAGIRGGENTTIVIDFNEDSDSKGKDKDNTPDEREGIEVEKEERQPPKPKNCDTYPAPCSDYDCRPLPEGEDIPAGAMFETQDPLMGGHIGMGSHTTNVRDRDSTYHHTWMMTAHQAYSCEASGDIYHQPEADFGYKVGEVAEIHPDYDMAIVEPTRGVEDDILPSAYVHESSDLHNGARYGPVENTLSKDGVLKWRSEERSVFRYGIGSCYDSGTVGSIYQDYTVDADNTNYCSNTLKEVIRIAGSQCVDGDSGSLQFCYYKPDDAYFGIGLTSGGTEHGYITDGYTNAVAGYRIDNDLGYYWKN